MLFLAHWILACIPTHHDLPRLEKVWRHDVGGVSQQLFFTNTHQLLLNIRLIQWNGKDFVREYDRIHSIGNEGKIEPLTTFPDKVRGLVYGPDGKRCVIVKGYRGHDLELWDLVTNKPIKSTNFGVFKSSFTRMCMNSQGTEILVEHDGKVERWDVATLNRLEELAAPTEQLWLSQLSFTTDGRPLGIYARHLNYENKPGDMVVWDFHNQKIVRTVTLSYSPRHIALTDEARYLIAAAPDGTIRLWEMNSVEPDPKWTLTGHAREFYRVIVHPEEDLIASASLDNSVILWDGKTQKPIARNTFPRNGMSMNLAFSPGGKHLTVTGNVLRDSPDGKQTWAGFVTQFKLPLR